MTTLTDKVDELFAQWNTSDSPGCAVAVIQNGKVIHKRGYGMADLERNVPLSPASVFDIGSTGKQFTGMLVALLVQQGALSLDDSIHQHIPELPAYEQAIMVRHLLHHTSGLRDYLKLMYLSGMPCENFYYEAELLDLICRQKELNFKPGDEHLYSNTGYFLLGVICQRITGKPFLELLRAYILEPLGMQATDFTDAKRIVKNRAIGYSLKETGGYNTEMSFCGGYGDGAILSTVEDLVRWDQNFYHNTLGGGGEELINQVVTPGELNSGEKLAYGFGLGNSAYRGLRTIEHAGAWAGYVADMIRFPDQKFTVICLANLNSLDPSQLALRVADLYLADQFTEQEPLANQGVLEVAELPTNHLESLSGYYRNQKSGNILKLATQDGKLVGEVLGLSFQLIATSSTHLKAIATSFDIQIELEDAQPDEVRRLHLSSLRRKPEMYQKVATTLVMPSQLADYVGDYQSDELKNSYSILLAEEQLLLKRGYLPTEMLHPVTLDLFISSDLVIQFERNEREQVCAFKLDAGRVRGIHFIK